MDDTQFRKILDQFGLSWEGYRKVRKGVKKRLAAHMHQLECRTIAEYLKKLRDEPQAKKESRLLLTVSISRFFRDGILWDVLETSVLPRFQSKQVVKAWSAGCARGEEIYSLKILWADIERRSESFPRLEIIATDVDPERLKQAQEGIYASSSLKQIPERFRSNYFKPLPKGFFAACDFLKEGITWVINDLMTDEPPGTQFDIVFLRNNLLTYYIDVESAFSRVLCSLSPGGFLIIGAHEAIPNGMMNELSQFSGHPKIFQKASFERINY